jgi:hypothetical protein
MVSITRRPRLILNRNRQKWKYLSDWKKVTAPEVPGPVERNGSYIGIIQWYVISRLNYHLQIQAKFRQKNTPEKLIKIREQFINDEENNDHDDNDDNLDLNLQVILLMTLCVAILHISNCSDFFYLKAVYV